MISFLMSVCYPELPQIFWNQPFFLIGLTGTLGSGKSSAAAFFFQSGAKLQDADKSAKETLHLPEIQEKLYSLFGQAVFTAQGKISRKSLANLVFQDETKRVLLNDLIHPLVKKDLQKSCNQLSVGDILVYDAPLLFEAQQEAEMDLTITTDAPQNMRYDRVRERSGWSREEFIRRERSQFSVEKKKQLADLVLINEKSLPELGKTVFAVYSAVKRQAKNKIK